MLPTINTLNFSLRIAKKEECLTGCPGKFYLELAGENAFDLRSTFTEQFFYNSQKQPFNNLADVISFSRDMAAFWHSMLNANSKLSITGIVELADVWDRFAFNISHLNQVDINNSPNN